MTIAIVIFVLVVIALIAFVVMSSSGGGGTPAFLSADAMRAKFGGASPSPTAAP